MTLDRASLEPLRRVALPCAEVYALAWAPAALVDGLRTGFGVNPRRVSDQVLLDTGNEGAPEAIDATSAVTTLTLTDVPASAPAGHWFSVLFTATNRGPLTLRSSGEHPVMVGARFTASGDPPRNAGEHRARLTTALAPGGTALGQLFLRAPEEPGHYLLHASLLQEHVWWFSDADPARGADHTIEVTPR